MTNETVGAAAVGSSAGLGIVVPVWQLKWEDAIIIPPSVSRSGCLWKIWRWQKHVWEMIMNVLIGGLAEAGNGSLRNWETNLGTVRQRPMNDDGNAILKHHLANLQGLLTILDCEIRNVENLAHNLALSMPNDQKLSDRHE